MEDLQKPYHQVWGHSWMPRLQSYPLQQGTSISHTVICRLRIEEKMSETEEGKLRLNRAELRKDAPHLERQGGGEQIPAEERGHIPATDEMNDDEDKLPARESAHGPRDGLDSAHGSQPKQPDSANSPLAGPPRSEDVDTDIDRGQGCTGQMAEIFQTESR